MSSPGLRFLLLEDNAGDAALVRRVVERMSTPAPALVHVGTLAEALATLRREPFDLVLTDLHVPDSDGLDTCRELCAAEVETAVVVLSGSHDGIGDAALALGAQDYLTKGEFEPDDLARVLRHARQRHALSQRLCDTERRLRHLLRAAPVAIYSAHADLTGRTTFISDNVADLLGHPATAFVGIVGAWQALIHPDDRERALAESRAAVAAGGGTTEYRIRHGDGRWVWVRDELKPAGPSEVVGCVSDISEHKRLEHELRLAMEAAVASSSAKSAFLSNMSHELRTPLNAVIGFAELLRDLTGGDLTGKQERWVENILTSGRHLLTLINDVLDLAKVDAGKMVLDVAEFAPAPTIAGVIDMVRPIAAKKTVAITLAPAAELPQIAADQTKFKQVLYNLLANAIKFTPAVGTITVRAELAPAGGGLRLRVDDTGIGIDPATLELIFEDFTQIEGGAAGKQAGTGLGLALARRMVLLHGGRIWAESAGLGKGTSVIVELPLGPPTPAIAPAPGGTRQSVLVVEDNDLDRELMVALLERSGYTVVTATTGTDALRLAKTRALDLVLLDLGLPDIDGLDLARRLKQDARTAPLPLIAVSARASRSDSAAALAAGCAIHIPKPFDTRTLRTVVHEILRPARRGARSG
jgi:PAS domain S-box-containing protein